MVAADPRGGGRRGLIAALTIGLLLGLALGGWLWSTPSEPEAVGAKGARVRDLLAAGGAQAEVDGWPTALELFRRAAEASPEEPVARFDIAVAHYRMAELKEASLAAAAVDPSSPPWLRARAALLEGRIALEEGDLGRESAAYRRAMELDPEEAAYPYALAQVVGRGTESERGSQIELLARAHRLWPSNLRLQLEFSRQALESTDPEARDVGLELLARAVEEAGDPELEVLFARSREELDARGGGGPLPVGMRRLQNLLRPTKRYQESSSRLEDRLQVAAIVEPVSFDLRRRLAFLAPEVGLYAIESSVDEAGGPPGGVRLVREIVDLRQADAGEVPASWAGATAEAVFVHGSEASGWKQAGDLSSPPTDLQVGDLDGDGLMEIVAIAPAGAEIVSRSGASPPVRLTQAPGLPEWSSGLLFDFEHDGDLDLLLLSVDGRLFLSTHRGEAGLGIVAKAPLPLGEMRVRSLVATDLDADFDQDLVLGGDKGLLVARNWRQGEFKISRRLEANAPLEGLHSADYDLDGNFDVIGIAAGRLFFWRGDGAGGFAPDPVAAGSAAELAAELRVAAISIVDLDLDGDEDLLVRGRRVGGGMGVVALDNRGRGHFALEPELFERRPGVVSEMLVLDLDRDGDADLLTVEEGALQAYENRGAEGQERLRLTVAGLPGKVPLDARGVRVRVSSGNRLLVRALTGPEVTIGLGSGVASVVRITWPNGISEYLYSPDPGPIHHVEQLLRVEGSCPFLYAWDGRRMRFVTDILGLSPVGMIVAPGEPVIPDPEEYLRLPDWVSPRDGAVELAVTEELREVAYFDQFELVVVDSPSGIEVYNGEQWIVPPVEGLALRLLRPLRAPLSVVSHAGEEVLDVVSEEDQRYLTNHLVQRLYQGAVEPHALTVEFPLEVAAGERPALLMIGWLHWANTSVNVARSQDPGGAPIFPYLEVGGDDGSWRRVPGTAGLPAGKTKPVVIDLRGVVDAHHRTIRLVTDFEVYWDRIAVSNLLPEDAEVVRLDRLAPSSATIGSGGFSRWFREAPNGPYLFDYKDRRPYPWRVDGEGRELPISWQEHEGYYSVYGPATDLLRQLDDQLAVIGAGDEILLSFDVSQLPSPPAGWRRTYFLHTEGWEKDGDPNVTHSLTVEPLPLRAIAGGSATWAEPTTPGRDRWVSRDRLDRRVTAGAAPPGR